MNYTQIPQRIKDELNHIKKGNYDQWADPLTHPSVFAHEYLKITPYTYQHIILRKFRTGEKYSFCDEGLPRGNSRTIICKSRQIGISICLAMLAIWAAAVAPVRSGPHNNCKVCIVSKTDEAAKKLMAEIKQFVMNSPTVSALMKEGRNVPSTKKEMHFENGWIKSFPPTDAIRGETADLLIIDEAAFVNGDLFRDAMEPTVSAVDGKIILSSTPKGQSGYFFETFDPFDVLPEHEYYRHWFHWQMCENEGQKRLIKEKKKHAKNTGNLKSFEQEYEAQFTVDEEAFFDNSDIDKGIDKSLSQQYESKLPCSIGLDYGISDSATCLTVVQNKKGIIELVFQEALFNFDENRLMDKSWQHSIPNLCERYKVEHIVVDDCAQGNRTNKQLENEGYPIVRFDFRSDRHKGERNRGYYIFRSALKQGRIRYPDIRKLVMEMKTINEIRLEVAMRIKAPKGYNDDRSDSFMMACYPFLSDDKVFSSYLVDYEEVMKEMRERAVKSIVPNDGRTDNEWNNHLTKAGHVPTAYLEKYGVR